MAETGRQSEPGKGSTFWFTHSWKNNSTARTPALDDRLANSRAHIVDDNATNREILHFQLLA